ncbi:hypothetical protein EVAR_46886_1 [Eumeta japonica]|uniref:Uncharacterized protein n=1 Tax=Eumeta variegata TaxID=151549 RepID=A0A4C1YCD3_EUMVA|nr:hypothetical protein EVAR_46886_1 [Eumeta japonica]
MTSPETEPEATYRIIRIINFVYSGLSGEALSFLFVVRLLIPFALADRGAKRDFDYDFDRDLTLALSERAGEPSERWSPPSTDTRNPKEVTSASQFGGNRISDGQEEFMDREWDDEGEVSHRNSYSLDETPLRKLLVHVRIM